MKGTGAKRNVCPGSCVSTGAKFPVAPVESAPMILVTLGPLYRFGPLGSRHCRGYRWLVTPLGKIGVVDCQIIGLTGIVLYKKQKHNMAGRPAFSSRTDKITT